MFRVGIPKSSTSPKIVSLREHSNGTVDVMVDEYIVFQFIGDDVCCCVDSGFIYSGVKFEK